MGLTSLVVLMSACGCAQYADANMAQLTNQLQQEADKEKQLPRCVGDQRAVV